MKDEPTKDNIELNGVAAAIAILDNENVTKEEIKSAVEQLHLFSKYVRQHAERPIFWHDFIKAEFDGMAGRLGEFFSRRFK